MVDPQAAQQPRPTPAVVARGITMSGPWGPVFGPLDLEIDEGGVTVLVCPAGEARTALLMTLAGRMKPKAGSLTVLGRSIATGIFGACALAGVEELDTVYESVTVRDLITEQIRWDAPWYRLIRRAGQRQLAAVCGPVFGPIAPPQLGNYVDQLTELDGLLLRIALANTARPPLLVVGGLDHVASDPSREQLVRRLVDLGEHQTVITASSNEIGSDLGVRTQIRFDDLCAASLPTPNREVPS